MDDGHSKYKFSTHIILVVFGFLPLATILPHEALLLLFVHVQVILVLSCFLSISCCRVSRRVFYYLAYRVDFFFYNFVVMGLAMDVCIL